VIFDIIGDIHGHALELEALLKKLGYEKRSGCYKHSERQIVFTGDFIDRGTRNEDVINIVRPMVESGSAKAVMGNHEYNAICFHTLHPETNEPLREHSEKNIDQHESFLMEFNHRPHKHVEIISWFKTLPLFLDLGFARIVHAEWDQDLIDSIMIIKEEGQPHSDEFFYQSALEGSHLCNVIETLLKGSEITLPEGITFKDKDGHSRDKGRIKWWESDGRLDNIFMVPDQTKKQLSGMDKNRINHTPYKAEYPPVFFGHYWLKGNPRVLSENAVCVDYSVGKEGGKLCCYSYMVDQKLDDGNFCFIERMEG